MVAGRGAGAGFGATPTTNGGVTVSWVCPATPLSAAVIVTVPGTFAAAFPLVSTLTRLASLELHCTCVVRSCVVLSEYVPVAINWMGAPTRALGFVGVMARLLSVVCVTVSDAAALVMLPAIAVIAVFPGAVPVARPVGLMVATPVLDDTQVTLPLMSRVLPSEKVPLAVNC